MRRLCSAALMSGKNSIVGSLVGNDGADLSRWARGADWRSIYHACQYSNLSIAKLNCICARQGTRKRRTEWLVTLMHKRQWVKVDVTVEGYVRAERGLDGLEEMSR
jgi:hypothetical protein